MAGLNQSFDQVFVASTPVLLAQGTTVDLAQGQVGIFDGDSYEATVNPTYAKNKSLIIAQGRADLSHLGEYLLNGWDSASDKSKLIKGKLITSWSGKKASRGKHEIITVGFDGADITKNLSGVDGINKHFYLKVSGDPITKRYSEQGVIRQYIYDAGCVDCGTELTDPEKLADFYVDKINSDKTINEYVRASKLLYVPVPGTPVTVAYTKYTVVVTDNGDHQSLAAVQVQYPGKVVKRSERNGYVSTYEVIQLASLAAPTAVSISQPVLVPDCPTCPAGFTLQAEQKLFLVERAVAPTTDLTTPAARQTYADTIKTAYNTGSSVGSIEITNGGTTLYTTAPSVAFSGGGGTGAAGTAVLATGGGVKSVTINTAGTTYTNGTHPLVFTGGGGSGAAGTATVAGGIFTAITITANGSGYTSNPTVTVPAAGAGSGTAAFTAVRGYQVASINITNAGTGYTSAPTIAITGGSGAGATASAIVSGPIVNTASFVSNDTGVAKVLLYVALNSGDVVEKLADVVTKLETTGAICLPPAGSTVAWSNAETLQAYQKTLKITVGDDCGDDVLGDIQDAFPDLVISQVGGTPEGNCVHLYQTNILSEPVGTDCSIEATTYTYPDAYKGIDWVDAAADELVAQDGKVAGIRIEAAFVDWKTDENTYDYFPKEYGPVYIEASYYNPDYNGDPCDVTEWPVTKIQGVEFPHGDGYMVRKREDRQQSLLLRERSINPGVRYAEGFVSNSKLDKYYDEYTIGFEFKYKVLGWSETYTDSYRLTVFVEEGQGKALEAAVNSYIVSTNVGLDPVVL